MDGKNVVFLFEICQECHGDDVDGNKPQLKLNLENDGYI